MQVGWESDLNFKDTQLELFKFSLVGYVELQHFWGSSHLMCVNLNTLGGSGGTEQTSWYLPSVAEMNFSLNGKWVKSVRNRLILC